MKKIYYFYSLLLTALFLLPWSGVKAEDLTLTVFDKTNTNNYVPIYGMYADECQHIQIIYPSSALSAMNGCNIKAIKFYISSTTGTKKVWNSTNKIRLTETESTYFNSAFIDVSGDPVYTGSIDGTQASKEVLITFDSPYLYSGGNLLYDFQDETANNYMTASFYGEGQSYASAVQGYAGTLAAVTATNRQFIPKTTFIYETAGCTTPKSLSAEATSSTSAIVTWSQGSTEEAWQLQYREKTEPESSWSSPIDVTAMSKTLEELASDKTYEVQVRSNCGGDDYSEWSESAEFSLVSCATVTGVSLDGKVYNGVTVNWTTSAPGNCDVRYKEADDADWTSAGTNIDGLSQTITGLVVGKTYSFQVKPNCSADGWVAAGETYTPVYLKPSSIDASSISDVTATINWSAVTSEGLIGYQYSCVPEGNEPSWSATVTGTSASLSGLAVGASYTISVRAVFPESGYSEATTNSFTTICQFPTVPQNGATTSSSLNFYWSKGTETSTDNQYQYICKEGSTAPTNEQWATNGVLLPEDVREVTVEGLEAHTTYYFFVRSYYASVAKYSVALSTHNTTDCGTETLPKTFSSWTAIPNCWYTLRTSDGAYYFPSVYNGELKFYGNNSSSKKTRKAVLVLPKFEKDIQNLQVVVEYQNGGTNSTTNPQFIVGYVTDPEDVETFHTIAELERYYSFSDYKTSDAIDLSSATADSYIAIAYGNPNSTASSPTDRSAYIKSITVSEIPDCPAMTEVTLDNKAYNSVTVNWTISPATNCDVRYSTDGGINWTSAGTDISETSKVIAVSIGNTYTFAVKPHCNDAEEAWVECAETYTPAYCAPVNAAVADATDAAASASWDAVADAPNGYKYIVVEAGETPNWDEATATIELTASLTGLAVLTDYDFYVGAVYGEHVEAAAPVNFQTVTIAPTDLVQGTTTVNSIAFSWSYAGAASLFEWKSSKEGSDWSEPISATNAEETGLTAGSSYTIYVRAYYADGKYSSELSETFGTECAVLSLPFSQDFEDGVSPLCWTAATSTADYYDYDGNYGWKVKEDNDGNYVMRYKSGSALITPALTLPQIDLTATPAVLSFKVQNNYSNKTVAGNVTVSAEGVENLVTTLTTSSSLTEQRIDLTAFAGKRITVKFQATNNAASGRIDLDDIRITEHLNLLDGVDNTATLSANLNKTIDVTIGRTLFCDGDFNTLCLPFDLPSMAGTPLANGELWAFKYANVENGELLVRIIEAESIEAGKPYLITFPNGDNLVNPLFKNVTITRSAGLAVGDEVQFIGILKPEAFTNEGDDVKKKLFVAQNGRLAWAGVANSLKSFRAYFLSATNVTGVPVQAGMPARIVKHDNTATGCENVNADGKAVKLLENNQVIIIRNGVKYTIQGQKIQ